MKEKKWSEMDKLEKRLFINYVRSCFQISFFIAFITALIIIWTGLPDIVAFISVWAVGVPLLIIKYKNYVKQLESGLFRERFLAHDVFLTDKTPDWDEYMGIKNG